MNIYDKILNIDQLYNLSNKKDLVLVNGTFDLIHYGHLRLLNYAKSIGSELIVLLNSDSSIKQLKGPTRPIFEQTHRIYNLINIQCVDYLYLFNDLIIDDYINIIKPTYWVKGGSYTIDNIDKTELFSAKKNDVKIVITDKFDDLSSTSLISRIKKIRKSKKINLDFDNLNYKEICEQIDDIQLLNNING